MTSDKLARFFKFLTHTMRWLLGIIVVFIAVLGTTLAWLSTPPGEQKLLRLIRHQLEQIVAEPVTINQLETDLFSHMVLSGITVHRIDSTDVPLINSASLTIRYSLRGLLSQKISIGSIQLDGCQFWVALDSTGKPDLPHLKTEPTEAHSAPSNWRISIAEFVIANSRVQLMAPGIPPNVSLEQVNGTLQTISSGYSFSLQAQSQLFESEPSQKYEILDLVGSLTSDSLAMEQVSFSSSHFNITGHGSVFYRDSIWSHSSQVTFNGQPTRLVDFIAGLTGAMAPVIAGETHLNLTSSGPLSNPTVRFDGKLDHLTATGSPALSGNLNGIATGGGGLSVYQPGGVQLALDDDETAIPDKVRLQQNYPNPFNPATVIRFELPTQTPVKITVYDLLGHERKILINSNLDAGRHTIKFNGSNLPAGVYFYRLSTRDYTQTRKMLLLK